MVQGESFDSSKEIGRGHSSDPTGRTDLPPTAAEVFAWEKDTLSLHSTNSGAVHSILCLLPQIKGFRIVRLIASGGMGTVFEAEQIYPPRLVAIKILHGEKINEEMLRRLELEAHVLAHLQHASIAQLYEAGTFEAGELQLPYIAMELVRGIPLTAFALENDLSMRQRLKKWLSICEAVDYAHKRGIIHRDLKPDNILVTQDGRIKILDFGVARVTSKGAKNEKHNTEHGQILGTLSYMSPEQTQGRPELIDIRTDVYALGLIGYELFTSISPFDINSMSFMDALRTIEQAVFRRPSLIKKELRGDLDIILLKALEKEKDHRYQSAAELAEDIRRVLDQRPILSRSSSLAYRSRKFIKRHPGPFIAGLSATLLIIGLAMSIAWSTYSYLNARKAQTYASAASSHAEQETYASAIQYAANTLSRKNLELADRVLWDTPSHLRQFEWGMFMGMAHPEALLLVENLGSNVDVRVSPNGRWAAIGRPQGPIGLWDLTTGNKARELDIGFPIFAEAPDFPFSSDSRQFMAFKKNEGQTLLHVYNVEDGSLISARHITNDQVRTAAMIDGGSKIFVFLEGPIEDELGIMDMTNGVWLQSVKMPKVVYHRMAYSPDAGRLAAFGDKEATVWDTATCQKISNLEFPAAPIFQGCFNADGSRLAAGGKNGHVGIWDVDSGKSIWTREGHKQVVTHVAFDNSGTRFATCANDNNAVIWNLNGEILSQLNGHQYYLNWVEFSRDDAWVVTASSDRTVGLWNAHTGQLVTRLPGHGSDVERALFLPNLRHLLTLTAAGSVRLWDTVHPDEVSAEVAHPTEIRRVRFSSTGRTVLSWSENDGLAKIWDAQSGQELGMIYGCVLTQPLFAQQDRTILVHAADHKLRQIDARNGRELHVIDTGFNGFWAPAVSDDGQWLLIGFNDDKEAVVKIWNLETGELVREIRAPGESCWKTEFVPNQTHFYIATSRPEDGRLHHTLSVWNPQEEKLVYRTEFNDVNESPTSAAFSPDGSKFVYSFPVGGKGARVLELSTEEVKQLDFAEGDFKELRFSPDNRWLYAIKNNRMLARWQAKSGEFEGEFAPHPDLLEDYALTPDSSRILTASSDNLVRVWETSGGRELVSFPGRRLALSPDGSYIALADGTALRIWNCAVSILASKQAAPKDRELFLSAQRGRFEMACKGPDSPENRWFPDPQSNAGPALFQDDFETEESYAQWEPTEDWKVWGGRAVCMRKGGNLGQCSLFIPLTDPGPNYAIEADVSMLPDSRFSILTRYKPGPRRFDALFFGLERCNYTNLFYQYRADGHELMWAEVPKYYDSLIMRKSMGSPERSSWIQKERFHLRVEVQRADSRVFVDGKYVCCYHNERLTEGQAALAHYLGDNLISAMYDNFAIYPLREATFDGVESHSTDMVEADK